MLTPTEPAFVDLLRSLRNRFTACRAGTTTLFVVPARQATQARGIDSSEWVLGLHKRSQIRALYYKARHKSSRFSVCRVWIWAPEASSRIFSTSRNLSQTTLLETLGKSWKFLLHHLLM